MYARILKLLTVCLACLALSACETTSRVKIDYRSASSQAPLEVPPDLDKLPGDTSEQGADTYSAYSAEQRAAKVGSGTLLPDFRNIQLERDGDVRWLRVKADKKDLWVDIKNFLGDVGLVIDTENPATGIIETAWAENRAKFGTSGGYFASLFRKMNTTGEMDKYRIRMEKDQENGWLLVYIAHQGLIEKVISGSVDSVAQTSWQRRPSDPGLESEMLRLLMVYLGVDSQRASSMLASGIRKARAVLATDDNARTKYIVLKSSRGHALRRLDATLDRMGAHTTASEDGGNLLTITYLLPKDEEINKSGFLGRLFSGGKKKAGTYRIRVVDAGEQTELRLVDKKGRPDTSARAGELIKLLFDGLK